jgi:hypothetical protein
VRNPLRPRPVVATRHIAPLDEEGERTSEDTVTVRLPWPLVMSISDAFLRDVEPRWVRFDDTAVTFTASNSGPVTYRTVRHGPGPQVRTIARSWAYHVLRGSAECKWRWHLWCCRWRLLRLRLHVWRTKPGSRRRWRAWLREHRQ